MKQSAGYSWNFQISNQQRISFYFSVVWLTNWTRTQTACSVAGIGTFSTATLIWIIRTAGSSCLGARFHIGVADQTWTDTICTTTRVDDETWTDTICTTTRVDESTWTDITICTTIGVDDETWTDTICTTIGVVGSYMSTFYNLALQHLQIMYKTSIATTYMAQ